MSRGTRKAAADAADREQGICRISARLYRFDGKPTGKEQRVSHSYLLRRKQGNLLICDQFAPVTEHLDAIDALGGIEMQLLANYVDGKKGGYHEMLYERFGCRVCYHQDERKMARTKTKCPEVTFGDEGLKLGADFEAVYFPNRCHTGNSLFRWRYRGKDHLFTGHTASWLEQGWDLEFNPEMWPEKRSQFSRLGRLQVDLLFPGVSAEGEEIHRFTDRTRNAFLGAIREKVRPRQGGLKAGIRPGRVRVVTNYVPEDVMAAIAAAGQFEFDKMKVHGNCALSLLFTYLEGADIMLFNQFQRKFRPGHPFLEALRRHVEEGGGLLLTDNSGGGHDQQIVSTHPFPEIAVRGEPAAVDETGIPELTVYGSHRATRGVADRTRFALTAHEHKGHRHLSYEGRTFESGPEGEVLVRNEGGAPVVIAGQVGLGRVVLSGLFYGVGGPTEGPERSIYEGSLRWLARLE